jgi:nitrate/nitrite transport system ATP-binding protein
MTSIPSTTSGTYLSISQVDMSFPSPTGPHPVLKGIDLQVARGEYISLIGHSGCGKSTVLNVVAGLLKATRGGVLLDNREVDTPGPDRAVVFQNHSLLPWLTVYQNVEIAVNKIFGGRRSAAERREWILHNLAMVNMSHALDRLPSQISGGMKQRVGIARALSMEPKVLLLDEPFGALDALTRAHLQDEVIRIQSELGNTVLMITHDVDEAVLMSDRVVMMTNGPAATIGQVLAVDLPRPRSRIELAGNATYNHCRQEILSFLYEKQRKVEPISPRSMKSMTPPEVALRA